MTTSAGYFYQNFTPLSHPHALSWPTSQRPANQSLHTRVDISHHVPCLVAVAFALDLELLVARASFFPGATGVLRHLTHVSFCEANGAATEGNVAVIFSIGLPSTATNWWAYPINHTLSRSSTLLLTNGESNRLSHSQLLHSFYSEWWLVTLASTNC